MLTYLVIAPCLWLFHKCCSPCPHNKLWYTIVDCEKCQWPHLQSERITDNYWFLLTAGTKHFVPSKQPACWLPLERYILTSSAIVSSLEHHELGVKEAGTYSLQRKHYVHDGHGKVDPVFPGVWSMPRASGAPREHDRSNGRHLNWKWWSWLVNWKYKHILSVLWIGTLEWASFRSTCVSQSPFLRGLLIKIWIPSTLK